MQDNSQRPYVSGEDPSWGWRGVLWYLACAHTCREVLTHSHRADDVFECVRVQDKSYACGCVAGLWGWAGWAGWVGVSQ